MNAYEIMLLLDSELADERQDEILTRARELVEKRGRHLGGAGALGAAQAGVRDRARSRRPTTTCSTSTATRRRSTSSRAC